MTQLLHIGQTKLGVFYVWAKSPAESLADTRRAMPALTAVAFSDMVSEDAEELRERFGQLLAEDGRDAEWRPTIYVA